MSTLPKLKVPTYEMTQPSTSKKIKFRPFLVKEEKIMLMAKESKDEKQMKNAMSDIVSHCTFKKMDMEHLPLFDMEYMFLQLRARSISETVTVKLECRNVITPSFEDDDLDAPPGFREDEESKTTCGNHIEVVMNFLDVEVEFPENHSRTIMLEDTVGITFRYPEMSMIDDQDEKKIDKYDIDGHLIQLVESIIDGDNIIQATDVSKADIAEFLENMSRDHYQKIKENFYDSMPKLSHTLHYKCDKCGMEGDYKLEGSKDFFL